MNEHDRSGKRSSSFLGNNVTNISKLVFLNIKRKKNNEHDRSGKRSSGALKKYQKYPDDFYMDKSLIIILLFG